MRRNELMKKTARNKGFAALGAGTLTVTLMFLLSWWIVLLGAPVTGYLTYRWLAFRGKWGLRF